MKDRVLLITLGFKCNNNCIFCSVNNSKKMKDADPERIIKKIGNGAARGYKWVEFIGGEPTLYPNIIRYVSLAKRLGYENIAMTTNGRMFSYRDFTKKIIDAGLSYISFSLYSHEEKTHDATTRTIGSYRQCVSGIKNALRHGIKVCVNTVVYRGNYRNLTDTGRFVKNIGAHEWHVIDLLPDGLAEKLYDILHVNMLDLSKEIRKLISLRDLHMIFFDFSQCIFSSKFFNNPEIVVGGVEIRNVLEQEIYGKSDRTSEVDGFVYDNRKTLTETCKKCSRYGRCGGIWRKYFDDYGDEEIKELAKEAGFLS